MYVALAVPFFTCLLAVASFYWGYRQIIVAPDEVAVYAGVFNNVTRGQKASLPILVSELQKHPHADFFVIERTNTVFAWDQPSWWILYYSRQKHELYDGNRWAGCTEDWGGVTDDLVRKVAKDGSNLDEFGKLGCKDLLP
jgi:hypothetical protein